MDYTTLANCRTCGSANLERILDLGRQPLANSYVKEPTILPVYPLELMVCRRCFHNQLSVVVNPDLMFRDYLYVSGTSRTLRDHFEAFARQTLNWFTPRPSRILDIACNDGTLLEAFRRQGCTVEGVDPARNLVVLAQKKGLHVAEGYWPDARRDISGQFDLITAANVLAHVADPRSFLQAALSCLSSSGAIVVEFPYCRAMILHGEWDTIYHEHLSYFLVSPLLALVNGLGASVTRAEMVPIHGGSLRLAIQPAVKGHCADVLSLAESEVRDGLTNVDTYRRFSRHVGQVCTQLIEVSKESALSGRRVIGFGASAKGNTLLNRCALSLDYIIDDNPLKHGHFTPGRNIPIRPPAILSNESRDLAIFLLAWNFAKEIVEKIRNWRPDRNDQVIHYVPSVHRHDIREPLPSW